MILDILRYYSSRRAACKQWSVFLAVAILLIGAWGRLGAANVVWAAVPLIFLGLAEAGYAAQERRYAELVKSGKPQDEAAVFLPESAAPSVVRMVVAVLSLSIWPFYLGLIGIVVAGSSALPLAAREPVSPGSHIVQSPMQPNGPMATGAMVYPSQMAQAHPPFGQQSAQMPPGMPPRQPAAGQNFPNRPPAVTPPMARNPLGTVPPGGQLGGPRPNVAPPKPPFPSASPVAPAVNASGSANKQ